ncbi:hypothetical protein ACFXAZ_16865 [Streptomyces sp. NPDC059477]|uniref:hypothetical protein n=1 Tax=Streptomyces sp. NPDC059477 TaxID=3346847 RepID=UPI0036CAAAF5
MTAPMNYFATATAGLRLAGEQWLLSTLDSPGRDRARKEWQEHGLALLPLGTLSAAVRLPGAVVAAVTGDDTPSDAADDTLAEILDDGPVICDLHSARYYALVPPSTPRTWRDAIEEWRSLGVDALGHGTYLGVPHPALTEPDRRSCASYWSVPMDPPPTLCSPLHVARLIAAARHLLAEELPT